MRLQSFCQAMVTSLLALRISSFIASMALLFSAFLTFTLFIPLCAMFFFFLLASLVGILACLIRSGRKALNLSKNILLWLNSFAIAFIFAPEMLSLIISFLLASSFRSLYVRHGLLLSKAALTT